MGPKMGARTPWGVFFKNISIFSLVAHYLCRKVSHYEYRSFLHIICTSRTISLKISKNLIMCAFLGILRFRLPSQLFFGQVARFHVYKAHIKFEIDLENWSAQNDYLIREIYLKYNSILLK